MLKVYKYPVPMGDYFEVELPRGAQVLKVEDQDGHPRLWALVDPTAPHTIRRFRFAGTGHPISDPSSNLRFINTFQIAAGALIFHIFEVVTDNQYKEVAWNTRW